MLDAAEKAISFADGRTRDDLSEDDQLVFALVKAVEIIGEAASQITSPTQEELPLMPWADIIGMRNRLVHAYFDINLDTLWRTVQDDLPILLEQLGPLVSETGRGAVVATFSYHASAGLSPLSAAPPDGVLILFSAFEILIVASGYGDEIRGVSSERGLCQSILKIVR